MRYRSRRQGIQHRREADTPQGGRERGCLEPCLGTRHRERPGQTGAAEGSKKEMRWKDDRAGLQALTGESHTWERAWGQTGEQPTQEQASQPQAANKTPRTLPAKRAVKKGCYDARQTQLRSMAGGPLKSVLTVAGAEHEAGGVAWTRHTCA